MSSMSVGAHSRPGTTRWARAPQGFAAWRRKVALAASRASVHIIGAQATVRRLVVTAAGLGFIDAAAYGPNLYVGLGVTGASLLVFNECMN